MARTEDGDLLAAARRGESAAFDQLVKSHRRELHVHCYRMLGSVQDAEDALQEALLGAWRGIAGFEGRSSLRAWLYQASTNACLRLISNRPRRMLSPEHGPPRTDTADLGQPVAGPVWIEPLRDDEDGAAAGVVESASAPEARYLRRESVELAFIAALQHLPGTQRAVLILREVMEFSAAEVADILDTSVASVNSALARARQTLDARAPATSQQVELARLGGEGTRRLVDAFVSAWERADLPALLALLAEDAQFTMPPLPAWFRGRVDVGRFMAERVFATPWRLVPLRANGQLGFACYQNPTGTDSFQLGAVNLLGLHDGRITHIWGFLDATVFRQFGLPAQRPVEIFRPDR